jgi:uncharacterized protein (TIGR02186 family)
MIRLALVLALVTLPLNAAEEVVAGLNQTRVAITTTFGGSEILVFGAIKRDAPPPEGPPLDVIIVIEGPRTPVDIRKKNHVAGIWVNTEALEIDSAPSFYAVATTGPLFDVISHTEDLRHSISINRGIRSVGAPARIEDARRFTDALIRLRMHQGLYTIQENSVFLREQTLFRTSVALPANLIEGRYRVRILLARGGAIVDSEATYIDVRKVGIERLLYNLAYDRPLLYGWLAIFLAAVAGWGASAIFRFIRN